MTTIYSGSIDLTKIDKTKIVTVDKDGKPFNRGALYLNLSIVVNDEPDKYGNTMSISINQSEQDRNNKESRVYLGNAKKVWSGQSNTPSNSPTGTSPASSQPAPIIDDLPF